MIRPTLQGPIVQLPIIAIVFCVATCTHLARGEPGVGIAPDQLHFFEAQIRPVLVEHCYECHSGNTLEGGLNVEHREDLRRGGDSGSAVVPGEPDQSLLLTAIQYDGDLQMPPDHKLPDQLISNMRRWIEQGAVDPREPKPNTTTQHLANEARTSFDWQAARQFWAFQPVRRQPLPTVGQRDWPARRHDYFILARLESESLTPSRAANRRTIANRLSFDLVGLPLSSHQRAAHLGRNQIKDDEPAHPDEFGELIDELLASPHFGERWGRVWLDLARYAEDQAHIVGEDKSLFYPNAYVYRDWVIDALNRDVGYDQFVRLQLAADLVTQPDEDEAGVPKNLAALGFLGLGPKYYDRGRLAVKAEEWEDRVDTVSRALLGLTIACARCHDHKYDPVPTEDYYALASVFASTEMFNQPLQADTETNKNGNAKDPANALHIVRDSEPKDLAVFVRGNVDTPGTPSHRGFLTVLSRTTRQSFHEGSGRRELADAIVDADNPLTARVLVNRIWSQLIGQPLVGTPSNFGALGSQPTHPRLLDDLTFRFMANGWSIKWLVREIVTSASYRQTAIADDDKIAADPQNRLLSHMNRKRLSAEAWRDRLLAASGRLDPTIGGHSMTPDEPNSRRRTVYSYISRFQMNPMLATLDVPDANVHSARRVPTVTPQQRLLAMNHPFVIQQADALSQSIMDESGSLANNVEAIVHAAYERVLGRNPSSLEMGQAIAFLVAGRRNNSQPVSQDHVVQAIHALMASNEMMFLD